MSNIIAFAGAKFAGKSTAASLFVSEYGHTEVSFAGPLKRATSAAFRIPKEYFDHPELKEKLFEMPRKIGLNELLKFRNYLEPYGIVTDEQVTAMYEYGKNEEIHHPRHLLQFLGTDLVRQFVNNDYWANAAIMEISKHEKVAISDMRFAQEREVVESMGGKLILIKRPGYEPAGHSSETSLGNDSDYDKVIINDGTIKDLFKGLVEWYKDDTWERSERAGTPEGHSEADEERDSQSEASSGERREETR